MGGSGHWYLEKSPHSSISCSPVVSWEVPRRDLLPWCSEAPLAENVPQRATYAGRCSVLSERRRLENLTRREQKGELNLRPRHSSGDTTIIPLSGLVNRWRTGSGSAPAGVAQSEGKIGKIFLFREKIKRGWDFLMRILLAFLACRCVGRGVR